MISNLTIDKRLLNNFRINKSEYNYDKFEVTTPVSEANHSTVVLNGLLVMQAKLFLDDLSNKHTKSWRFLTWGIWITVFYQLFDGFILCYEILSSCISHTLMQWNAIIDENIVIHMIT